MFAAIGLVAWGIFGLPILKLVEEHRVEHFPEWVTAIATAGLVYATFALVGATNRLQEVTRQSIRAADASAEAAVRSANIAEEAFRRLDRPYVLPEQVGDLLPVKNYCDTPLTAAVQFNIGNYGRTPAIVHRVFAKFAMLEIPVTQEKITAPNFASGETRSEGGDISKVLVPSQTHGLDRYIVAPGMQKVAMEMNGNLVRPKVVQQHDFFLQVNIRYEDAATGELRDAFTLWKLGLEGFERYGGRQHNYERQIG